MEQIIKIIYLKNMNIYIMNIILKNYKISNRNEQKLLI